MDKQKTSLDMTRVLTMFRSMESGSMDKNTMWNLFLSIMLLLVIGVGIFAYFTYNWAVSNDDTLVPVTRTRDTQTITELKEILAHYEEKEKSYVLLLVTEPPAPSYRRGSGAVVPSSLFGMEDDTASTSVAVPDDTGGLPSTTTPKIID